MESTPFRFLMESFQKNYLSDYRVLLCRLISRPKTILLLFLLPVCLKVELVNHRF